MKATPYTEPATLYARHTIGIDSSVRDALTALNMLSGDSLTLFVIGPNGEPEGSVTDGDIRRALIAGVALEEGVARIMHRNMLAVKPGDDVARVIAEGHRRHIEMLPVVRDNRIAEILDLRKIKTSLPVEAVLMAGGRGERLRPLTDTVPKPLLEVGGKAIIDYNIDELEACGVENIYVTVNYRAEQIEAHFDARRGRAHIECVREPKRLGTMGSLALVPGLEADNILMMNSDLLTTLSFEAMYLHHLESGADLTMAGVPYNVSVPFALMTLDNGFVTGLQEKPTYNYFANGGVYLMKRSLLQRLTPGEYTDAPDFITDLIADGGRVACHPVDGTWIDIGSPSDYRYANELMKRR